MAIITFTVNGEKRSVDGDPDTPEVDVHAVRRGESPGGVGESAVPPDQSLRESP